ncbi:hypothetical protein QYE76_005870 [Lolium multiflorum]|uniref:Uncharacterized protein n=1 Tax=Lolium multiflorum TaxID=4521 RepID=A0AAD8RUJ1_LOLMU|nr:hypothetical protein QYE76_005870 [Lolium multiflorum]
MCWKIESRPFIHVHPTVQNHSFSQTLARAIPALMVPESRLSSADSPSRSRTRSPHMDHTENHIRDARSFPSVTPIPMISQRRPRKSLPTSPPLGKTPPTTTPQSSSVFFGSPPRGTSANAVETAPEDGAAACIREKKVEDNSSLYMNEPGGDQQTVIVSVEETSDSASPTVQLAIEVKLRAASGDKFWRGPEGLEYGIRNW